MGHDFLWQSRHVDARPEQSASQRLLLAFFGIERDMRGSDVKSLQIFITKSRLGDSRAGQAQRTQQLAGGRDRCSPQPPKPPSKGNPRRHDGPSGYPPPGGRRTNIRL